MPVGRFDSQSRLIRVAFSVAAVGAYVLAFFPLYPLSGSGTAALVTAPVVALAWLWGLRGGLVAGFLTFPLNTLLFNLVGLEGWDPVFREGGGPGQFMLVLIGAGVGHLRDLGQRLKVEIAERKQTVQSLEESEKRYRGLVESSLGLICTHDLEGTLLSINPAAAHALGYEPAELVGRNPIELLEPSVRHFLTSYLKRIREQKSDKGLTRIVAKDGTERIWAYRNVLLEDPEGKPYVLGHAQDITEFKRVEEALKFTQFTLDYNADPAFWIRSDGRFSYVNDAACRRLGYSREELLSMTVSDIDPDFPLGVWPGHWQDLKERGAATFETCHRTKEGRIFPVEVTANHLKYMGKEYNCAFARDITDRKRAEEEIQKLNEELGQRVIERTAALHVSEEQYRTLAEAAQDVIFVIGTDRRIGYVNAFAAQRFGMLQEDLIGRRLEEIFPPEIAQGQLHSLEKIFETGEKIYVEREIPFPDGEVWLSTNLTPIRNESGRVVAVLGISRDITERKHLEEQLRQSQKMDALGQLAGGVAHDFNNILMVIQGYSEFLLKEVAQSDPLCRSISEIQKAADLATSLIQQLVAFSRGQVLVPKVLDLNVVAAEADKMLRRLIGEDINLITVEGLRLGRVEADPGQVKQVILNLAVNARDAMPRGGKLIIETANAELDEADVYQHADVQPGRYVMLAVSDTGSGMDLETQSHIFEPFFTTKKTGKGTGLGLSIVYGIVKQSGGHIRAYSKPGQGTTFKVYLPRVEEADEAAELAEKVTEVPQGSETVLLVEDHEGVQMVFREYLKLSGYQVLEASNGTEALRVAEKYEDPIHLMLTDVVMPEMSGRELAARMAPLRPEMKVLYTSGYADSAVVHHGVLDPGKAFLRKPFTLDALAHKLRQVLGPGRKQLRKPIGRSAARTASRKN